MLCNAAEEFPNEPKILLKLAQALHMWGWNVYGAQGHPDDTYGIIQNDVEYNAKNTYWHEAVSVYEKLLNSHPSSEDRETAIRQLTPLYCRLGQYDKAKKLASEQNSIIISKELLLPEATVGEENARYQGERLTALLSSIKLAICESIALRPSVSKSEYGKELMLSVINLFETVFIDSKCGRWHWDIGSLYLTLSCYEMDNGKSMEKTLLYFDKAFDHCEEYKRISAEGEYSYTAPLVAALPMIEKGSIPPFGEDFWEKNFGTFPKDVVEEIRKNPKYAVCFKQSQPCADN